MIQLFEIENNVVKPTVHCKMIAELDLIQVSYANYLDIFAYLFYMSCYSEENPYFNVPENLKEELILKNLKSTIPVEDIEVVEALEVTTELYTTPTVRSHQGIKILIDNMADYMATTTISAGRDGNITALTALAKNFDVIRQSYKGVTKDLKEEQAAHARGGQDLAYDQKLT